METTYKPPQSKMRKKLTKKMALCWQENTIQTDSK